MPLSPMFFGRNHHWALNFNKGCIVCTMKAIESLEGAHLFTTPQPIAVRFNTIEERYPLKLIWSNWRLGLY